MSIAQSAMIVALTVHCWTARKQDKQVAKEVDDRHGAKDAGRYNKLLIDKAHIQPLQSLANAIREEHYKLTLPWMDNGGRLLPSKLFMDWRDRIEALRESYRVAVEAFVDRYEATLVPEARQRLGTLYNPADYPRGDDVRAKFGVTHDFMPVPSANDFRVDISEDERQRIQAEIAERMETRQREAMAEAWARVRDCVSRIYDRTSADKPVIHDSLMENTRELLGLLPGLNVANDPALSAIAQDIGKYLVVDTIKLRNQPTTRTSIAAAAKEILARIPKEL
jgi:hypothetical protein